MKTETTKSKSLKIKLRQAEQNKKLRERILTIFDNLMTIILKTKSKKQYQEMRKITLDVYYLLNAQLKGQKEITNMELEKYK